MYPQQSNHYAEVARQLDKETELAYQNLKKMCLGASKHIKDTHCSRNEVIKSQLERQIDIIRKLERLSGDYLNLAYSPNLVEIRDEDYVKRTPYITLNPVIEVDKE